MPASARKSPEPDVQSVVEDTVASARWLLLAGVWLIYLVFGIVTVSLAPLVGPISADLGIGEGLMGVILGAWPLTYIAAALPAGALLDRIGARRGMLLGCGLIAVSVVGRALAQGPWSMALAVAVFGLGGPLISVGAPKLIARLFEGSARGFAMGLYVTGPYLGGALAFALTNSLLLPLAGGDWRQVMLFHAALVAGSAVIWIVLSGLPGIRPLLGGGVISEGTAYGGFAALLRARQVRLILAMAVGIFALVHAFNNWLPALLEARGLDPVAAGRWAAISTLAGIVGALGVPRLAVAERRVPIMCGLILAMLAATILLGMGQGANVALLAGLVLQGIARGTMMTVAMLLLMESGAVPKDRVGLAGGLFFTVAQIGGVIGPAGFGIATQAAGGFALPLASAAAVCLLLLFLLMRLARA